MKVIISSWHQNSYFVVLIHHHLREIFSWRPISHSKPSNLLIFIGVCLMVAQIDRSKLCLQDVDNFYAIMVLKSKRQAENLINDKCTINFWAYQAIKPLFATSNGNSFFRKKWEYFMAILADCFWADFDPQFSRNNFLWITCFTERQFRPIMACKYG